MKKALVSVANKAKLVEFLQGLKTQFSFLSTGGTYQHLSKHKINCSRVEDYTGFPEILNGRVKSIHPKIYAGLLSLRKKQELEIFQQLSIENIDMVVVNFYPFSQMLVKNLSLAEMLEYIDIGGPSMLRAAAKNYPLVLPICDIEDYHWVLEQLQKKQDISLILRKQLAAKAFLQCSELDKQISEYLGEQKIMLRYGENPHQTAYLTKQNYGLAHLQKIQGKELSYNNYLDIQAASNLLSDFSSQVSLSVVIKHNNPCGVASGTTPQQSLETAWQCDVVSAFGSIIATNYPINLECAKFLVDPQSTHYQYSWKNNAYQKTKVSKKFFEILMAPSFAQDALTFLQTHTKNHILLRFDKFSQSVWREKKLDGVCLHQEVDWQKDQLQCVTKKEFPKNMESLVRFGIVCCKHADSNTVVLVWEYFAGCYQLLGIGHSQPNRIDAFLKLALPQVEENLQRMYTGNKKDFFLWQKKQKQKLLLVSDAFFPFSDLVEAAYYYNICYIVQPGGSKNDQLSINFCDKNKMSMLFNGLRHFRH